MSWVVRVIERDAIEINVVVAVGEAAEKCLAVAQTHAVGIYAEGARRHLQQFAEIRVRRGKVLNKGRIDFCSGRARFQQAVHRRKLRRDGVGGVRFNGNCLAYGAEAQWDRKLFCAIRTRAYTWARGKSKAWGGYLHGIAA